MNYDDFLRIYNSARYLTEQEETQLVEILTDILDRIRDKRFKGGYIAEIKTPISEEYAEFGSYLDLHLKLVRKDKLKNRER